MFKYLKPTDETSSAYASEHFTFANFDTLENDCEQRENMLAHFSISPAIDSDVTID